jgi:NTP pyrophosphatase (non-canonical NTP hydrolase)
MDFQKLEALVERTASFAIQDNVREKFLRLLVACIIDEGEDVSELAAKYADMIVHWDIIYAVLGMNGEAGEAAEKVKRVIRGQKTFEEIREDLALELGDVLWYIVAGAKVLGYSMEEIATMLETKLEDRKERGVIKGDGDHR